jgi:predicted RNase H-like HicB family nuclease
MTQAYKVVIEHDNQEGYVATFPELADCRAQAESLKALMKQIRVALAHQPEEDEGPSVPNSGEPAGEPDTEADGGKH